MPRKTQLRLLSERPAPETGDLDERAVIDVFSSAPPPAAADDALANDILEILRKSHDRIEGEVRQAHAASAAALERVEGVVGRIEAAEGVVQAVAAKTAQVEQTAAASGQEILSQVSRLLTADRTQSRQMAAASMVTGLAAFGERLGRALAFAVERAPALLALAAAIWLFARILPDPKPLQLITLGLFGAVVIAPAIWLGRCIKGSS
jgi:hypothetical protein